MLRFIFVVEDRFEIEGKGLVLTGAAHDDSLHIAPGAIVRINRPALPPVETEVLGFELFRNDWSPNEPRTCGVLVSTSIGIDNVPLRSEIWADA